MVGPDRPGRLNDVRYIIYKDFEQTQQEADPNFGLMLREGLLKENIDGEALPWAYFRLAARPEQRKILIVGRCLIRRLYVVGKPGNILGRALHSYNKLDPLEGEH
jgi:cobalamin biosynthesis protein CobT